MYLLSIILKVSQYPILGVLSVTLIFSQILRMILEVNIEDPDQTTHYVVSDLDLHCLPMSHKKDARLLCV